MQKELIHFTQPNSEACAAMEPIINKLVMENPDISYVRVDVSEEHELFEYYYQKYPMNHCPSFLGIVDGKVQDGHIGQATQLILESLVN